MTLEDLPDLMNVPELARYLRVSDKKVYQLIADGEIEAIRLGSTIRIAKHAVRAFIGLDQTQPAEYGTLRAVE